MTSSIFKKISVKRKNCQLNFCSILAVTPAVTPPALTCWPEDQQRLHAVVVVIRVVDLPDQFAPPHQVASDRRQVERSLAHVALVQVVLRLDTALRVDDELVAPSNSARDQRSEKGFRHISGLKTSADILSFVLISEYICCKHHQNEAQKTKHRYKHDFLRWTLIAGRLEYDCHLSLLLVRTKWRPLVWPNLTHNAKQ